MKDYLKILAEVLAIAKESLCTGSRAVADPPVLDTDLDIVVPINWGAGQYVHSYLQSEGFRRWQQATDWAQQLNLRNREDRRMFFNICLYGPERVESPTLTFPLATPVPQQ